MNYLLGKHKGQVDGKLSPLLARIRLAQAIRYIVGTKILDCGCGSARILRVLEGEYIYTGIDVIKELIDNNKKKYPEQNFYNIDIEKDDLQPGEVFDTILMAAVLEHFADPRKVLNKLRNYLKEDGVLIVTTPAPFIKFIHRIGSAAGLFSKGAYDDHKALLGKRALLSILADSGFLVVKYQKFCLGVNQLVVAKRSD